MHSPLMVRPHVALVVAVLSLGAALLGELAACEGNSERLASKLGTSPALLARRLAAKR
jgi:hypothetical protein